MKSSDSARITLQESLFNVTKGIRKVFCWFTVAWEFEPDSRRVDFFFPFFPGGSPWARVQRVKNATFGRYLQVLLIHFMGHYWKILYELCNFCCFSQGGFFQLKVSFQAAAPKNDMKIHSAFAKSFVWKQLQTIQQQISQQLFSQQFWDWGEIARTTLIRDTCGKPSTYLVWNANNDA